MVASRRRSGSTGVRKKATFLLSNDLLQHLNAAISAGVAPSKNAFVEEALVRALLEVRRRDRKARLEAAILGELVAAHPHPVRSGKQPRILFATQASTRPPRFVIFASGFLEAGYRRFIERRLREEFGFEGTPIEVSVRVREKRRKK